jgi:Tol biopolymer transport system component
LILLNLFLVSCAAREVKPVVSPTVAPNTAVPSATPQLEVTADSATNVPVTEPASSSGNDALGQLYFFTLPHQSAQSPQMVRLPGSCVVGLSACPQLESLPAPFPFSFNLSPLAWSPDGAFAAFAYSDNVNGTPTKLWTFDPSTDKWISLAQFPFIDPPFWSPDGAWIAFRAQDGMGGEDVYVVRSDGTGLKELTASDGLPVAERPYVMDGWLGDQVVMHSALPGHEGDVYLLSVSDGKAALIFRAAQAKMTIVPSPDQTRLAYVELEVGTDKHNIKVVEPTGANLLDVATFVGDSVFPVVWSPDSMRLAFAVSGNDANFNPVATVYRVGSDGLGMTQVFQGTTIGRLLFSPDGQYLLVDQTTSATGGHLFAVNLETLKSRVIDAPGLSLDTDWYAPSWRP